MMPITAAVPDGVDYSTGDDADVISWSNRKLDGGQSASIPLGVLLLWLSAALWITDWAIFGSLPGVVGGTLAFGAWGGLLFPLHRLLTLLGRESVRVGDDEIEFTFMGLCWPRTIVVPRGDLQSLTVIDRDRVCGGPCRRLLSYIGRLWSKRPPMLLLAEWMEHEQKVKVHALLCDVLARRGWTIPTAIDADIRLAPESPEPTVG